MESDVRSRKVTRNTSTSLPLFDFLSVKICPSIDHDIEDDDKSIVTSHEASNCDFDWKVSSIYRSTIRLISPITSSWNLRWVKMIDNIVFIYKNEIERDSEVVYMFTLTSACKIDATSDSGPGVYGFSFQLPFHRGVVEFSTDDPKCVELWMMTMIIRW